MNEPDCFGWLLKQLLVPNCALTQVAMNKIKAFNTQVQHSSALPSALLKAQSAQKLSWFLQTLWRPRSGPFKSLVIVCAPREIEGQTLISQCPKCHLHNISFFPTRASSPPWNSTTQAIKSVTLSCTLCLGGPYFWFRYLLGWERINCPPSPARRGSKNYNLRLNAHSLHFFFFFKSPAPSPAIVSHLQALWCDSLVAQFAPTHHKALCSSS